jgi:hypothetical protein
MHCGGRSFHGCIPGRLRSAADRHTDARTERSVFTSSSWKRGDTKTLDLLLFELSHIHQSCFLPCRGGPRGSSASALLRRRWTGSYLWQSNESHWSEDMVIRCNLRWTSVALASCMQGLRRPRHGHRAPSRLSRLRRPQRSMDRTWQRSYARCGCRRRGARRRVRRARGGRAWAQASGRTTALAAPPRGSTL